MKPESLGTTQLYRHFDAEGRLLYVGISLSAVHRLAQHKKTAEWHKNIAKVTVETFETREAALFAETVAIQTENPTYNKQKVLQQGASFERMQYSNCLEISASQVMFYRAWKPVDVICDCVYEDEDWDSLSFDEQEESISCAISYQIVSACFNFSHVAIRGFCDLCGKSINAKELSKAGFHHSEWSREDFYRPAFLLESIDTAHNEVRDDFFSAWTRVPEKAPASDFFQVGFEKKTFMKWGTWIALNEKATA
jgi:hypothetical protein